MDMRQMSSTTSAPTSFAKSAAYSAARCEYSEPSTETSILRICMATSRMNTATAGQGELDRAN